MIQAENSGHKEFEFSNGNKDAVVFVHGILGSPCQFGFLAEGLFKLGFDCRAVLLPGHGKSAWEFSQTSAYEWQEYFTKAVNDAKKKYNRVFIAGHSMGGLLCLGYASESDVSGIVLINTPLIFRLSGKQVGAGLRTLLCRADKDDDFLAASRQAYSITGGNIWSYPFWLRQFAGLYFMAHKTRDILAGVRSGVLIAQSGRDESVNKKSAALLETGLINARTQNLELSESYHYYFTEPDKQKLLNAVEGFIGAV
jgi:esterase/lipase